MMLTIRALVALGLIGLLGACAHLEPQTSVYHLSGKYDSEAVAAQLEPGENTIEGAAFIRQRGGGVVTCAGNRVDLFPVSPYTTQRKAIIFGMAPSTVNTRMRSMQSQLFRQEAFIPDPPAYRNQRKTAICDAQGNFRFERLKDGDYYIITAVSWRVAGNLEGGGLATKVYLSDGKGAKVIMTP